MDPKDLLVTVDHRHMVKIGGYLLPAEDYSLTNFMLHDLGMTWLHPGGLPSTERMLESLSVRPDARLLDLGCGVGSASRFATRKYKCEVVGIDHNPDMIKEAIKRSQGRRYKRVSYELMDGNQMTFEDNSFDFAILQSVTCFNDKLPLLREVFRVLKPGGQIALNEVTWLRPPSAEIEIVTRATVCETFKGALLDKDWLDVLSDTGFRQVSHQSFGFKPIAAYQILREEGFFNTLRTFARVFLNPENVMRLSAVSDYFRKFPGYFGYGIYIASKPEFCTDKR